jgi:hypothetical protein
MGMNRRPHGCAAPSPLVRQTAPPLWPVPVQGPFRNWPLDVGDAARYSRLIVMCDTPSEAASTDIRVLVARACKVRNWHATPQQIAFAVLSTCDSSWAIAVTYPSGV